MKNSVTLYDSVDLITRISDEAREYYLKDLDQKDFKPLRIRVAATHSGRVTRNNGFYLPEKMKAGVDTWTSQYSKPILKHHNDREDPIGRVIEAKYVDISTTIRNSLKDSITVNEDKELESFINGELSVQDAISYANRWIINDLKLSNDPDYMGLGYIELLAEISDRNAAEKFLDKRYLTGSVGVSTNHAFCSVEDCGKDWASGRCKHTPGKTYDGQKCVLVTGDLNYKEWSPVNKPADEHSQVIELNVNGITDSVNLNESIPEITLITNKEEQQNMLFKDALAFAKEEPRFKDKKTLVDDVKNITSKNKKLKDKKKLFELLDAHYGSSSENEEVNPVEQFWGDSFQEIVGKDNEFLSEAEEMFAAVQDAETDEEKETLTKIFHDATLTAAQRKKLPDSAFCAPDRGFPVNDCAHYTAALRLLPRYKGPGDKDKIRACIERKGKRLGCSSSDSNDCALDNSQFSLAHFDQWDDAELTEMFDGLQSAMKEREMEHSCPNKEDSEEVSELKDKITVLRKEIRYLYTDIEQQSEQIADYVSKLRDASISHIVDLKSLDKKSEQSLSEFTDELKEKSSSELVNTLDNIRKLVDIKGAIDSLNSGLSNENPAKQVEDPTIQQDNTSNSNSKMLTDEQRKEVKSAWFSLKIQYGKDYADSWVKEYCEQEGVDYDKNFKEGSK